MMKKVEGVAINSIILTFVKLLTMFVGIATTKVISMRFSLNEYGTYSQALLVSTMCTSLTILGMSDAINYFFNNKELKEKRQEYVSTIFTIQLFIGLTCAFVIFFGKNLFANYFGNYEITFSVKYIALSPLLSNFISMLQVLYISNGNIKVIAIRNTFLSIVKLGAVVFAGFVTKNINTVLAIMLCVDIFQCAFFFAGFEKRTFNIRISYAKKKYVKKILLYSLPMGGYILLNTLMREVDKLIVGRLANTSDLAIYTNAAKVLPFDLLTASFAIVLMPYVTKAITSKNYQLSQKIYSLYLNFSLVTTLIFTTGALIVSKELMMCLYDVKYIKGVPIFIIYILVDLIRFANVTLVLSAAGRTRLLMRISIAALISNTIFSYVSFQIMGIFGPAMVTFITILITNLAVMIFSSKNLGRNIFELFDIKRIIILCLQIIMMSLVCWNLKKILIHKISNVFFVFCITYGIYIVVLGLLNAKKIICYMKEMNSMKDE